MIADLCRCSLAVALSGVAMMAGSPARPIEVDRTQSVAYFHEARLRKLHLVRPDLISYPVSFDVVC